MLLEHHELCIEDAVQTMDGTVTLRVTEGVGHLVRLVYEGSAVVTLSWQARWARAALLRADYLELDATYRAGRPYLAIVPTAVIRNAGLPLGLVLTPSERAASYDLFWDDMGLSPEEKRDHVFARPLLSDGGQALRAYGRRHVRHFTCMRHIRERMGSRTYVAILARRLMFAGCEEHYSRLREQCIISLQFAMRAGIVAEEGGQLFCRTFGLVIGAGGLVISGPSDPFRAEAIWGDRAAAGVSTCSNHVEGLHSRLNAATGGIRLPHRRMKEIVDALTAKAAEFRSEALRSPRRKFNELREAARAARLDPTRDSCNCGWGGIYTARFALARFPCVHTVLSWGPLVVPPMDWTPDFLGPQDEATISVAGCEGAPWPFPGDGADADGEGFRQEVAGSETETEVCATLNDGASFARMVWRDMRAVRPGSIGAFVSFEQFLLQFGAFAAHAQGVERPDLFDRATRAAFEIHLWLQA
jgi:hypothetical protein